MKAITQHFIGTTAEWENENPLLYKAVWGIEETQDGKRFLKLGDGVHYWNELPYVDKYMIKGLPENLDTFISMDKLNTVADDLAEHKADTENPHATTAEQLEALKLTETGTQILSGNAAFAPGKKLLGTGANGSEMELIGEGIYGDLEQVEVGSVSKHLNLNTDENGEFDNHITVDTKDPETHEAKKEVLSYQSDTDRKIDKAIAGASGKLLQDFTVDEDTGTGVTLIKSAVSVASAAAPVNTQMALPIASNIGAGVMPKESFSQIEDNTRRIESIENKSVHYPVTLTTAAPTQEELQSAYEAVSGRSEPAYDMTSLDDLAYGKTYTWYDSQESWVSMGSTIVAQATNTSLGIVKGSETGDGKAFVENDGSLSVIGWDTVKDDISNLAAISELLFPVGGMLIQYPDEQSPVERGLPGTWEIWSSRAIIYGIGTSASTTQSYVERQACGNPLTDSDLAVGDVITSGTHTGKYITGKITPAGSFFGVEGGNRPAFVSGGKQPDRIRNFSGELYALPENIDTAGIIKGAAGSFGLALTTANSGALAIASGATGVLSRLGFNPSLVVPTGADNAGPNISCRVWRRIPDINN
jgi:hypothetical protein